MLYSGNLLKKFININDSVEQLSKKLTLKTCEIEDFKIRKIPIDVVIGKIIKIERHPDADKLYVCNVNCGNKGNFQIVTGGENVLVDEYVPVALPGCFLNEINLKIESRKMRGVDSSGMICSKNELGIKEDEDKHWIWLLLEDFDDISDSDIGNSFVEKYPWLDNFILDVDNKTLTNRPDLTGHFGVSCELNSIYQKEDGKIKFNNTIRYYKTFLDTNIFDTLNNSSKSNRKITSKTSDVNSYLLIKIDNIMVKESSFFTRSLLLDSKLQPRNNWIDFSNLFMLLSGQPIHFFDADKVDGDIIVRNAQDGELFVDLFDVEHVLEKTDIVIADKNKILGLAGIIGGKNSGIDENTKNILVEIANFDPIKVRKTGTRLNLRTDAEIRFEKNINPAYSLYVLIGFLDELKFFQKDLGDYLIDGLDFFVKDISEIQSLINKKIEINKDELSKFLFGKNNNNFIDDGKLILEGLGFKFINDWNIKIPVWRSPSDINIKEDVFEEVARIFGYENITENPSFDEIKYAAYSKDVEIHRKIEEIMVDLNCNQVETYPWLDDAGIEFSKLLKTDLLSLQNPLTPDSEYLRNSILYPILLFIKKNSKFYDNIKLFEIGKVWIKQNDSTFLEKSNLIFCNYIKQPKSRLEDTFIELKSYIEIILNKLNIKGKIDFVNTNIDYIHPKKQGNILINGNLVGTIGQLHPINNEKFKLFESSQTSWCELDLSMLKKMYFEQKKGIYYSKYETLQDQIIWRDLSFVIKKTENTGIIIDSIKQVKGINDFEIFDIYTGNNIGEDEKSISVSIKIVGDGTLTTQNINDIMNETISLVESNGGKLRS